MFLTLSIFISEALKMITDPSTPDDEEIEEQSFIDIYQEAMDLYGLIHQRFILTSKGLALMRNKYEKITFGVCPRVMCNSQSVLPIGMSEHLKNSRVKVYCPKCEDVFKPKKKCSDVDGAYFGTSFPHIFLKKYPELIPTEQNCLFVPRIFGYKIYQKSGSKYKVDDRNKKEITYYEEEKIGN